MKTLLRFFFHLSILHHILWWKWEKHDILFFIRHFLSSDRFHVKKYIHKMMIFTFNSLQWFNVRLKKHMSTYPTEFISEINHSTWIALDSSLAFEIISPVGLLTIQMAFWAIDNMEFVRQLFQYKTTTRQQHNYKYTMKFSIQLWLFRSIQFLYFLVTRF